MFINSYVENLLQRILDKLNELKNIQERVGEEREPWIRITQRGEVVVDRPAIALDPYGEYEELRGMVGGEIDQIIILLYWREKGSLRRWL